MKRSRQWVLGTLAALCLGAGGFALERSFYPVEPDLSGLETGLQDFWMRGRPAGTPPEMLVHQHLPVGDRIYVLFEVGPELDLGTAALERSWTWPLAGGPHGLGQRELSTERGRGRRDQVPPLRGTEHRGADRQGRLHPGWKRLHPGDPPGGAIPGADGGGRCHPGPPHRPGEPAPI